MLWKCQGHADTFENCDDRRGSVGAHIAILHCISIFPRTSFTWWVAESVRWYCSVCSGTNTIFCELASSNWRGTPMIFACFIIYLKAIMVILTWEVYFKCLMESVDVNMTELCWHLSESKDTLASAWLDSFSLLICFAQCTVTYIAPFRLKGI